MPRNLANALFRSHRKFFWIMACAGMLLDQGTKFIFCDVDPSAPAQQPLVIIPHLLSFVRQPLNPRAAFGLGPASPHFYTFAAVAGLALVLYFVFSSRTESFLPNWALGLIASGALGNLIDRLRFGAVRDFISLHWKDVFVWPTFNVADSAICIGVAFLLLELFLPGGKKQPEGKDQPRPSEA